MGEGILIYGVNKTRGKASDKIAKVLADIRRKGFSSSKPFSIGTVEKRMSGFAQRNGITLGSKSVYMSVKSLAHARRDSKTSKGLAVSESDLISFPKSRRRMELYYDGDSFIYTNRKTKYIVHPNYEIKTSSGKSKKVAFVTAGIVSDPTEFNLPKYRRI